MISKILNISKKIIIFWTALAVVFFVLGYFTNQIIVTRKEKPLQERISQQAEQISLLEEVISNSNIEPTQESSVPKMAEKECPSCENDFPKVVFVPSGLFEEEEKEKITRYLINPYFAFNQDQGTTYVSIMVTKNSDEISDYRYDIQAVSEEETYAGFLYGEETIEDWWIPGCMGGCTFSEDFQEDFPEVVEKYEDYR